MGERAQQGYEEAERKEFARLPWQARLKANALATLVVGSLLAVMLFLYAWPLLGILGYDR